MVRIPVLSGNEIMKALSGIGYRKTRQCGSHVRLEHQTRKPITVPAYRAISRGLLKKILRDAELSAADFSKLL